MSALDVAIVGAGAAGVAAGRALVGSGLNFRLFEARDRIGGRAWTEVVEGWPLDLGCGWLHSGDRNPWTQVAEDLGQAVDRTPPPWGRPSVDRRLSEAEQRAAWSAYETFERRLREAPPTSDRASDALVPGEPWNDHFEALSGYINGAELEQLSVRDFLNYEDADTGVNWRAPEGYGALVTAATAGLPITLCAATSRIDLLADGVRLMTAAGEVEARACIVTVSTGVLAQEDLRLPASLAHKVEAARRLPLGLADKLVFALGGAEAFEADTQVLGDPRIACTGAYHLRPFGRPLVEGFFGGACARALEADGAQAADFALDELASVFGSDIRRRLRLIARSAWGRDPFACGSYSHALPGFADARAVLAEPVENRLFFAGEACSRSDFSTAHGAFETGRRAAMAAMAVL